MLIGVSSCVPLLNSTVQDPPDATATASAPEATVPPASSPASPETASNPEDGATTEGPYRRAISPKRLFPGRA